MPSSAVDRPRSRAVRRSEAPAVGNYVPRRHISAALWPCVADVAVRHDRLKCSRPVLLGGGLPNQGSQTAVAARDCLSCPAGPAIDIHDGALVPVRPLVHQGVAVSGVEAGHGAGQICGLDGDVGNAADIQHHPVFAAVGKDRLVKARHQGRALAAGLDIGTAEICNVLGAVTCCDQRLIAVCSE
jgi:hypothetical protein